MASDDIPLNRAFTIGAHNAYASLSNGYWFADQALSLEQIVAAGAHWLALDIWWDGEKPVLQHNTALINRLIRPYGAEITLESYMERIANMLRRDPNLILIIDLEDYVPFDSDEKLKKDFKNTYEHKLRSVFDRTVGQYLLKNRGQTEWPTLREMRSTNKRLVLLSQARQSEYFFPYFNYTWATRYGTLDPAQQMLPLDTNKTELPTKKDFAVVAHFPTMLLRTNWRSINTTMLDDSLTYFKKKYPSVTPSMVSLNFVGYGDARKVINKHFPNLVWF